MSSKITITDVAKAAGASLSAVSFVLNGKADKHRLSHATQDRIRTAINQLGFQPSEMARHIAQGKSRNAFMAGAIAPVSPAAGTVLEPTPVIIPDIPSAETPTELQPVVEISADQPVPVITEEIPIAVVAQEPVVAQAPAPKAALSDPVVATAVPGDTTPTVDSSTSAIP